MVKKIGILATGNEVVDGDILNTNGQHIAQSLFQKHIKIGQHVLVSDSEEDLISGLEYLLKNHDAVITIGGLGPTSDDSTRFAISKVIGQPLEFHEETWQFIVDRICGIGYKQLPDNNKQQAMFSPSSTIFNNPNGSARGCLWETNGKYIYMLPGPPKECLPMFQDYALPHLLEKDFATRTYFKKWLLFGVSEGEIAEKLDALTADYNRVTGYRIAYPYLEFKIFCDDKKDFEKLIPIIEKEISSHLIGNGKDTASLQLENKILEKQLSANIKDKATGGYLESILLSPKTATQLSFNGDKKVIDVTLSGIDDYWQQNKTKQTTLTITINGNTTEINVPMRGERTPSYAAQIACIAILKALD